MILFSNMKRAVLIITLIFIGLMAHHNLTAPTGVAGEVPIPERNIALLGLTAYELGGLKAARPLLNELKDPHRTIARYALSPGRTKVPPPSSDPAWQSLRYAADHNRTALMNKARAYAAAVCGLLLLMVYAMAYTVSFYLQYLFAVDWLNHLGLRAEGGLLRRAPNRLFTMNYPTYAVAMLVVFAFPIGATWVNWGIFRQSLYLLILIMAWVLVLTPSQLGWHYETGHNEGRAIFQSLFLPIGTSLIIALALALLAWLFGVSVPPGQFPFDPSMSGLSIVGLAVVLAPIVEEVLFRGLLYDTLRSGYGVSVALFLTALAFAVPHVQGWQAWPILFGSGLVFGWIREHSGGLIFSILGHAANNAFIIALFLLLTRPV